MPLESYRCGTGEWVPQRTSLPRISFVPTDPPPPPPPPPPDPDLGVPGNRPALDTRPTAADTGPRVSAVQSLSGSAAMAAVRSAPVEADGKKYLRRTNITGTTSMSDNGDTGIVFEDCTFTGGSTYVVNAFQAGIEPTNGPDFYPEFRYCEISGGSSATIIGGYSRFLRCNIHFGIDLVKAFEEGEFYGCYLHGNNHPSGAHCDTFQITTGAANLLIHWNNCLNFNADNSETAAGQPGNGVLQTGTVTGPIGPVTWENNWFDGGGYTIRTGDSTNRQGNPVTYTFRNNRFGRGFRYGPLLGTMVGVDFDASNVWDDTGLPVEA